jgi:superfamily II RNA helicase
MAVVMAVMVHRRGCYASPRSEQGNSMTQLLVPIGGLDDDAGLDALLDWLRARGTTLFAHQEEAVLELFAGRHVILATPTGSGKSLVALAMHWRGLCRGERSVYTSPIKALVSEKFFELCQVFGAQQVGLLTGDASVNRDAPIICCTAEILANLSLAEGAETPFDHVVMDEFHYYADRDRGMAWQIPLLTMPRATFLLLSATLGDTTAIRADLKARTGREVAEVWQAVRPVPLSFDCRCSGFCATALACTTPGCCPATGGWLRSCHNRAC